MPDAQNDSRAVLSQEAHYNEIIEYLEHNNIFVPEMMQYITAVKGIKRPENLFRRQPG